MKKTDRAGRVAFRQAEQRKSLLRDYLGEEGEGRWVKASPIPKEAPPELTERPQKPDFRWSRGYFAFLAVCCWCGGLGVAVEVLDPSMTTAGRGAIWSYGPLWFLIGFAILFTYVAVCGRYLRGRDIGGEAGFISLLPLTLALAAIVVFNSTPYKTSKAWVASSEGIAEMLGQVERVYPSMFLNYSVTGDTGRASFGFMTYGERASGRVAVRLDRHHGKWRIREATLNGKRLDTNDWPPQAAK